MFDQSKDEARLIELNSGTFAAEDLKMINGQPWDAFLKQVLSEDFWIRRANSDTSLQNKEGMIAHIRSSENYINLVRNFNKTANKPPDTGISVRTFDKVSAQVIGDYGIVTCVVKVEGNPNRFHNFKVFARHEKDWQCVYWRVTKVSA